MPHISNFSSKLDLNIYIHFKYDSKLNIVKYHNSPLDLIKINLIYDLSFVLV